MTREPHAAQGVGRRQLQQIMAHLSEGVILLDPDGAILWANRAALDMHGCATQQDLGESTAQYAERFLLRESGGRAIPPSRRNSHFMGPWNSESLPAQWKRMPHQKRNSMPSGKSQFEVCG